MVRVAHAFRDLLYDVGNILELILAPAFYNCDSTGMPSTLYRCLEALLPSGEGKLDDVILVARFRYDPFCSDSRDFHPFAENSSSLCAFIKLRTTSRMV